MNIHSRWKEDNGLSVETPTFIYKAQRFIVITQQFKMLRLVATCLLLTSVCGVQFLIKNTRNSVVWIGIEGNSGKPALNNGGFVLVPGATVSVYSPDDWAGRFWARTRCDWDSKHCLTGDCGNRIQCDGNGGAPPVTLVGITLRGSRGIDYYYVSLVDGYNIEASIQPVAGEGDGSQRSCKIAACRYAINAECPNELKLENNNVVIGCKSACEAFNTDQYCCRGAYNSTETCRSSDWPVNYPRFFKDRCPDAYSYAFDDQNSTFTCNTGTYYIQFGF
ncbi:hypothetical protein JTB14_001265 [Gonioctena quinquepunctata]|nr:hypothetical protein JTB14_001265 [Gonioctena quinquepunctata]